MGQNAESILQDLETKEHATINLSKVNVVYIYFIQVKLQKDYFK